MRGKVLQVKELHKESLLSLPNVVGVGTGFRSVRGEVKEDLCIVAMVREKIPRAGLDQDEIIPSELNGIRTDVLQVGVIRAHASRQDRWRPAMGGVSMGHYKVTAGTLACLVRDGVSGDRLLLSNNHVFANSNDAAPGDFILQPGAADGGRVEEDSIAVLERFYPLRFNSGPADCQWADGFAQLGNLIAQALGSKHRVQAYFSDPEASNLIDAAVARPIDPADVEDEILEIGLVGGTTAPQLGMQVRKSGRSTGLTTGTIVVMDSTVNVFYGERQARFEDQLVTTPMSKPGDSGSLLVAGNSLQAVGLLFAGSDQATIYNPIRHVLDRLGVVL